MAQTPAHASNENAAPASVVLLVDDQPEVRRVVRRNLARAGHTVIEAWNGRVAVELATEITFDLVISDVHMPDLSGLELLVALRELDPDLPVVLTSGSIDPLSSREASALGVFAYLEKPVAFEALIDTAQRAIETRRARAAGRESIDPSMSVQRLRVSRDRDDGGDDEP